MGRKKVEINPESGKRLSAWLKRIDMTQGELASITDYTQQHISAIINGKKHLSYDVAKLIARKTIQNNPALYPPTFSVRPEWLTCQDNKGMTDIEAFDNALDTMVDDANTVTEVIKMVAKNIGCNYRPIFREVLPDYISIQDDACYGIIQNKKAIGLLSLEEGLQLREEIQHYAEFLFMKSLEKAKKSLLTEFPEP